MGQLIQVEASPIGQVALFSTDRSLTGQDGVSLTPDTLETLDGADPPHQLARRLFDADSHRPRPCPLQHGVGAATPDLGRRGGRARRDVIANLFVHYATGPAPTDADEFEQLRVENYNATLTHIRAHNDELWVMRVTPDEPIDPFDPGSTPPWRWVLGASGGRSPRQHEAHQEKKMARRSYSVSSSMVDDSGDLLPAHTDDVEFYIVKVRPDQEEIPALTPRIFLKTVGDRIYLGRKFTGRYTLEGVEPTTTSSS